MRPATLVILFLVPLLAGCVSEGAPEGPTAGNQRLSEVPAPMEGAIDGILLDDRFRPIAGGLVLLHEWGLTVHSGGDGAFYFEGVPPGEYTLRVSADGHEAVPQSVEVVPGAWTDVAIVARRTAGALEYDDRIVLEFALRVPCQLDAVVLRVGGCLIEGNEGPQRAVDLDHTGLPAVRMTTEAWVERAAETSLSYDICETTAFVCYVHHYDRHRSADQHHMLDVRLGATGEGGDRPWHNDQPFELEFRVDRPTSGLPFPAGLALEVVAQVVHTVHLDYADPEARSASQTAKSRT